MVVGYCGYWWFDYGDCVYFCVVVCFVFVVWLVWLELLNFGVVLCLIFCV